MTTNNEMIEQARRLNSLLEQQALAKQAALTELKNLQISGRALLQREARRLGRKLGEAHPRVERLNDSLKRNLTLIRELDTELEIAKIRVPTVAENETLVHGRINDEYQRAITGMKVNFTTAEGEVSALRGITADQYGYFSAVLSAEAVEELSGKALQFSVSDEEGKIIYQQEAPITLETGKHQLLRAEINRARVFPFLQAEIKKAATGLIRPKRKAKKAPAVKKKTEKITKKTAAPRYLGNLNTKEIHDLKCATKNCQIDEIAEDHRVAFKTQKDATEAGYDFCAYCFGKDRSKR